jgi:hypothetical protein
MLRKPAKGEIESTYTENKKEKKGLSVFIKYEKDDFASGF